MLKNRHGCLQIEGEQVKEAVAGKKGYGLSDHDGRWLPFHTILTCYESHH